MLQRYIALGIDMNYKKIILIIVGIFFIGTKACEAYISGVSLFVNDYNQQLLLLRLNDEEPPFGREENAKILKLVTGGALKKGNVTLLKPEYTDYELRTTKYAMDYIHGHSKPYWERLSIVWILRFYGYIRAVKFRNNNPTERSKKDEVVETINEGVFFQASEKKEKCIGFIYDEFAADFDAKCKKFGWVLRNITIMISKNGSGIAAVKAFITNFFG